MENSLFSSYTESIWSTFFESHRILVLVPLVLGQPLHKTKCLSEALSSFGVLFSLNWEAPAS